jgi:hypothetical protein
MSPPRLFIVVGLLAVSTGCGDKSPTAPASSTIAVNSLAIVGPNAVLTGLSANYTATATFGDGSTRPVTPTWTTSNPGLASVDGAGHLDGRVHGSTALTATYQGRSVSKTVQVVNNYEGTWEGRYIVRACTDTGDLTDHDGGWCLAGPIRVGTVAGISMRLVQNVNNPNEVTRTFPRSRDTLTGTVTADGRLTLGGTLTIRDFDYDDIIIGTVRVDAWDTNLDGPDAMTGHWSEDLTSLTGRKGTAHSENELVTMTRVSTSVVRAPANTGEMRYTPAVRYLWIAASRRSISAGLL